MNKNFPIKAPLYKKFIPKNLMVPKPKKKVLKLSSLKRTAKLQVQNFQTPFMFQYLKVSFMEPILASRSNMMMSWLKASAKFYFHKPLIACTET